MIHRNMARRKNLAIKSVSTPKKEDRKEDKPVVADFTREEIEKMPFMKLRSVAKKNGLETDGVEAKEMRSELIKKFGL